MTNRLLFEVIFTICILFQNANSQREIKSSEYSLYKKLLANYSKTIRPVKEWSDILKLSLSTNLLAISNVVEDHQSVKINVRMDWIWTDENLKWEPKTYNNLKSLVLPASSIWIPDLHLLNSASEDDLIFPLNAQIYSNGTVMASPIFQLNAHCDFDFRKFPYDTQSCDFTIGTMMDKTKLGISLSASFDPKTTFVNPEWQLISFLPTISSSGGTEIPDSYMKDWSTVRFTLTIKRISTFYINLFVYPLILILFISMTIFILPPLCVERASLGVLLILTIVIMLLMLESYTPKNSFASSTVIGKLISFNLFMVTVSTIVCTVITSILQENLISQAIPSWLKKFMLNYIAKIVCRYNIIENLLSENQIADQDGIQLLDTAKILQQQQRRLDEQNRLLNNGEANPYQDSLHQPLSTPTTSAAAAATSTVAAASNVTDNELTNAQSLLVLINNQLAMFRTRLQDTDATEHNLKQWYMIALALDRFCLIVYAVIIFLGLFIIFV